MKLTCISDLHGNKPELPGGDLVIIAGDWTAHDRHKEYDEFDRWVEQQDYRKKIVIAGNHEKLLFKTPQLLNVRGKCYEYLCDSGIEFEGLKIWGTPWTNWFDGINPDCNAWMLENEWELAKEFALIPEDIDILISHGPCNGRLDYTTFGDNAGSIALLACVNHLRTKKLKYHIHGHIHEAYGRHEEDGLITLNVSRMTRAYYPSNPIVNIEI